MGEDGVQREVLLVRSAKDQKLGKERSNPYCGCLALLLGEEFKAVDTTCASINSRWTVYSDLPTVRLFQDKSFLDYNLKDRLSDASVDLPERGVRSCHGIVGFVRREAYLPFACRYTCP